MACYVDAKFEVTPAFDILQASMGAAGITPTDEGFASPGDAEEFTPAADAGVFQPDDDAAGLAPTDAAGLTPVKVAEGSTPASHIIMLT